MCGVCMNESSRTKAMEGGRFLPVAQDHRSVSPGQAFPSSRVVKYSSLTFWRGARHTTGRREHYRGIPAPRPEVRERDGTRGPRTPPRPDGDR